jgi:hypothetical protein
MAVVEIRLDGEETDVMKVLDILDRVLSVTGGVEAHSSDNGDAWRQIKVDTQESTGGEPLYDFTRHPQPAVLPDLYKSVDAALWTLNSLMASGAVSDSSWLKELRVFHLTLGRYLDRTTQ